MKRLLACLAGLAVLTAPAVGLAAIQGSDHDLTGSGEKLCFACHIPHNALGDKLWASTPSGTFTGVQDLCYTCHDGTVTSIGATTAFDPLKEQHKNLGATDCSAPTGACHNVHTQNPNGTGRFLNALLTETQGSWCVDCHDATPWTGAEVHGDHTAGITHFTNGTTFTCNQCHTAHGATAQTTNPGSLTNPILLDDNQTGAFYGTFCISCHGGTAPTEAVTGTGGVASSDPFDYSEATNDGTEWKHPTTSTTGSTPVGGCNKCHDPHDPGGTANSYILMADNTDSGYCVSCHGAAGAPPVGANTHYTGTPSNVNMNNGLTPALPWANQIDEDGNVGADYPGNTANEMVCQTCHSVHRQGYQVASAYLLRDDNSNNEICRACHTSN